MLRALSHSASSASVGLFCAAGGDELRCAVLQVRICQRAYKLLVETVRPPVRHRIGPQAPMCHAACKRQQAFARGAPPYGYRKDRWLLFQVNFPPEDIIFDPNILTIGTVCVRCHICTETGLTPAAPAP